MKYSLRSLMILMLLAPPVLALAFRQVRSWYVESLITETGSFDRRTEEPELGP